MPTLRTAHTSSDLTRPQQGRLPLVGVGALTLALTGCVVDMGNIDPDTGFIPESQDAEQVIVGSLSWSEVTTLPSGSAERINSHAVGYISIPNKGTRCTGFLISDDVVMTNEHCISSQTHASGVTVSFRREAGVPFSEWATYTCDEFLGDSASLDFALLRCAGSPGQTHGVVELEASEPPTGHELYVIQQNCDYYSAPSCSPTKKIAFGQVTRRDSEFRHNADTLGGSSGSPVFSQASHKVFALHHVGVGNDGNGRGSYNYAVPMSSILNTLASSFPSVQLGGGTSAPPPPPAQSGDAFEPNNSAAAATAIDLPFTEGDLTLSSASDVDVYRVEIGEAGSLHVALDFAHAQGDIDVTLHVGNTSNPAIAQGTSANNDELISHDVGAGTYFVVVYGYNGAMNDYGLDVTFDADAPAEPPPPPPPAPSDDNSIDSARVVALPHTGSDAIDVAGDEDFYAVTTSGGTVTASISFSHSAGDLDLYLYNSAGQQVASSLSVTDAEQITRNLGAGTYFVRVIGYSGATGSYSIQLQ